MADDSYRRIERLANEAKRLDDVIQKAAQMQKRIVEELKQIGKKDKLTRQRSTRTPRPKRRRS